MAARTVAAISAVPVVAQVARLISVVRTVEPWRVYWERRAGEPGDLTYVAIGDSLTQGIGASRPDLGLAGLVATALSLGTGRRVRVINHAISGVRLREVLAGQLDQAELRRADLVTVVAGTNDAGRTSPTVFGERFAALCDALPRGALVADLPDFFGGPRRRAAAELSAIARDVRSGFPALVGVPLEAATSYQRFADRCRDLYHPSDLGYRRRYLPPFVEALRAREWREGPEHLATLTSA